MSRASKIEWTDATWNPIVGCSIVSPGCTNCYAMRIAARLQSSIGDGRHLVGHYAGTIKRVNGKAVWTGKLALAPEHILTAPLRWQKPRRVFVNSMGDLFHESVPDEWIDKVFAVMARCPQHQFQVLTKRAERMRFYCAAILTGWLRDDGQRNISDGLRGVLPHVWLGVSAERQQEADERIPDLLATPAAIRFVSCEPLLGPINLRRVHDAARQRDGAEFSIDALTGMAARNGQAYVASIDFAAGVKKAKLDWVIVGGESGPGARPMHPSWPRAIRDQCKAAGVPFFFKQWGNWVPCHYGEPHSCPLEHVFSDGTAMLPSKKAAGRLLDGVEHNEWPVARCAPDLAAPATPVDPSPGGGRAFSER